MTSQPIVLHQKCSTDNCYHLYSQWSKTFLFEGNE